MSAQDVYRHYIKTKESPKLFFEMLINAIVSDFNEKTGCEYLSDLMGQRLITRIEKSVLYELMSYWEENTVHYCTNTPYFPIPERNSLIYYPLARAYEYIEKQEEEQRTIQNLFDVVSKSRRSSRKDRRLPSYPIVTALPAPHEHTVQQTQEETDRLLADAQKKAAQMERTSQRQAIEIEAAAKANAVTILANAKSEAERIRTAAHQEAVQEKVNAQQEARQLAADTRQRMEAQAHSIVIGTIDDFQQQLQNDFLQTQQATDPLPDSRYHTLDALKTDFCRQTNQFKQDYRQACTEAVEQLSQTLRTLQETTGAAVRDWQTSLFHNEYEALARCYGQLYTIITQNPFLTDCISAETAAAVPPQVLDDLKKLKTTLTICLSKFDKALRPLGLTVYYPSVDEPFDDVRHSPFSQEDMPSWDAEAAPLIERCITPGIILNSDDSVLVPAIVTLHLPREQYESTNIYSHSAEAPSLPPIPTDTPSVSPVVTPAFAADDLDGTADIPLRKEGDHP